MKLAAYLDETKTTYAAFAERIGVSVFAVGKYVRGQRMPRPQIMSRIKAATSGHVTADDFLTVAANDAAALLPSVSEDAA